MDRESKAVCLLMLIGVSGEMPDDFAPFLCGSVGTNHIKSEPDKRLRLYRMSMVWIITGTQCTFVII